MQYKQILIILLPLALAGICIYAAIFTPISADAPYYLGISRNIAEGHLPYSEAHNSYTPLMMFLNSIIYLISPNTPYYVFVIFQFFILAIGACFLFKIFTQLGLSLFASFFFSSGYLLMAIGTDGHYIVLEPYMMLFTLVGLQKLMKPIRSMADYWLAGICVTLAFMSKQYGVLLLIPFSLLVVSGCITSEHKKLKPLVAYVLGGSLSLIVILILFNTVGITLSDFLNDIAGTGYKYVATKTKTDVSLLTRIIGGKVFIFLLPVFLWSAYRLWPTDRRFDLLALAIGAFVFLLPTIVRPYQHYYLSSFPFFFIVLALIYKQEGQLYRSFLVTYLLIAIVIVFGLTVRRVNNGKITQVSQNKVSEELSKVFPPGSKVFVIGGARYLYLTNNYLNPFLKDIGYDYNFEISKENIDVICAENIVLSKPDSIVMNTAKCHYHIIN